MSIYGYVYTDAYTRLCRPVSFSDSFIQLNINHCASLFITHLYYAMGYGLFCLRLALKSVNRVGQSAITITILIIVVYVTACFYALLAINGAFNVNKIKEKRKNSRFFLFCVGEWLGLEAAGQKEEAPFPQKNRLIINQPNLVSVISTGTLKNKGLLRLSFRSWTAFNILNHCHTHNDINASLNTFNLNSQVSGLNKSVATRPISSLREPLGSKALNNAHCWRDINTNSNKNEIYPPTGLTRFTALALFIF